MGEHHHAICSVLSQIIYLTWISDAILCVDTGPLDKVTDITRSTSTITWEAPFSLNLTNVDPSIVYCVEVVNITCGAEDLVVGDCDVIEPRYVVNRLQQGHVYRIAITPRSIGENPQNGTSNTLQGTPSYILFHT